jgi:hypothetical protein
MHRLAIATGIVLLFAGVVWSARPDPPAASVVMISLGTFALGYGCGWISRDEEVDEWG